MDLKESLWYEAVKTPLNAKHSRALYSDLNSNWNEVCVLQP
jgi:hypothetical protein